MDILRFPKEANSAKKLLADLEKVDSENLVLFTKDDVQVQFEEQEIESIFDSFDTDIVFAASADFPFNVEGINLYYWKYYPRERGSYHFVYSEMLMGRSGKLQMFLKALLNEYGEEIVSDTLSGTSSEVDAFHRYYIDVNFGFIKSDLRLSLDREQKLFGVSEGRRSVAKWPLFTLRHGLIFYKYEREKIRNPAIGSTLWDFTYKDRKIVNTRISSTPAIVSRPEYKKGDFSHVGTSLIAYLHSLVTILKMLVYNGGKRKDHEIFRFRHNQNPEINSTIEKLIGNLESGQAFSFTHFNDGEMTFIKKYEVQDHKEVWFGSYFGRIQDKYNKQLGELLEAAFLKRQDHYYIGIPCEISHPKLSQYAKELRPIDEFTVPAMTFHHNLSKYPRILGAIRKRKMYFVVNVNQDLTFFKKMGFKFDDEQIIRVPFRNAHEQYNTLKEHTFEDGAVVLLMSGMLAKILCAHWFEHNSKTTFIAFGSSFDDYIQSKINFNLYPKNFPFSKTLIGSRSYLFGHKKNCPGCYDMSKPNPGN